MSEPRTTASSGDDEANRLIIVDDDPSVREELGEYLQRHGFRVTGVDSGRALRTTLQHARVDLIILDLSMPGEDGLSITRELRQSSDIPIIILTGTGTDVDEIVGLEVGADDYVTKPCDPRQLLARVRNVLRRGGLRAPRAAGETPDRLAFAGWVLDPGARRLTAPDATEVPLTTAEFTLLHVLATRPHRVLSRDQLMDLVYGREHSSFDRAIDNLVYRLRQKIEADMRRPMFIKTVRSIGYVFSHAVDRHAT